MTSPSRRRAPLAALALLLALPGAAAAFDLKLWPLFRYTSAPDGTLHWSALGPLVEYTRTPDASDLEIRPLLWLHRARGPGADGRAEILFPVATLRWHDDFRSGRFLLLSYRSGTPPPEPGTPPDVAPGRRFTLFPFVFYREGAGFGVFPFYLDLHDFLGFQEVKTVLFPLYLRLTEPRLERRYYLFPFVSTLGGEDGRGVRVWPFYGTKEIVGKERSSYVLWPFHVRTDRLVPGYGWEHLAIDVPVYASIDGPVRQTRAYAIAGYVHTVDRRLASESIGAPWPFYFRERALGEEAWRTWRLVPVYGRSDRDGISSRFYAWPCYRTKTQDQDDFHFRHQDALLILWRREWQWNDDTGRRGTLTTLFPLLRSERQDDRSEGQVPALADSLLPHSRGVRRMWAPLYGVARWDTAPAGTRDWSLLWGLVAREDGHLQGPWRIALDPGTEGGDGP